MKTRDLIARLAGTLLILLITALISRPAMSQTPQPQGPVGDDQVNAVARELYCPVCENTPLDVCPTRACADWRELIRQKLAEGWNADQVKQYFAEQYGDRVLAVPPRRGLNWLVYVLPPLVILGGALLLIHYLRRGREKPAAAAAAYQAPATGNIEDKYIAKIEEELKQEK